MRPSITAALGRRALLRSTMTRTLKRHLAYNIYDDQPQQQPVYSGEGPMEVAESIFLQHSKNGALSPGNSFKAACASLALEYPDLQALQNAALEGRAFEMFNETGNGLLDREEFCRGVTQLLEPTEAQFKGLKDRLEKGFVHDEAECFSHVKKIAIIGGGVAGLQALRALTQRGKECVVFEKADNVGGVWRQNYADFGLQVPRELYEFPEYPYPTDKGVEWEKFPSGPQVQKYIESYTEHFDLTKSIRLNTGVHEIASKGSKSGRGFRVHYTSKGAEDDTPQEEDFDFVVVTTGMYSWPPHIPRVRNQENFAGDIVHSSTFTDASVTTDKKVVVIGGGKSAIDNAVAAAKVAESSTLVYRTAHWPVPRYLLNLVPFKWGTYSRFGHFMLPTHREVGSLAWYMHGLLTPVKWTWWRIVETMFRVQFRLPKEMLPTQPLEVDVFTGGQILNYEFRDMLRAGEVKATKGSLECFTESGVTLQDGTTIEADVVVFGTGFAKSYQIFDRLLQNKLDVEKDGLYLYRNILPPRLPDLAFVGSEVSTFNNILTHGLQAEWLARVLDGEVKLPRQGQMSQTVEMDQAWKRTWMPGTSARAAIQQLHMVKYHDTLTKDMGESHLRKGWNILAEIFAPYKASDYRDMFVSKPKAPEAAKE